MLKVLTGVDDSDRTKEIVYGVDKYHYVYERMVDYVFGNTDYVVDFDGYAINDKYIRYRSPAIPITVSGKNLIEYL